MMAVRYYQLPLGPIGRYNSPWQKAPQYWRNASGYVAYARRLANDPAERTFALSASPEGTLTIGTPVEDRVAMGDQKVSERVDKDSSNGDSYVITLDGPGTLLLDYEIAPCGGRLTLMDMAGTRMGAEGGDDDHAIKLNKQIKAAGRYQVWAACSGGAGHYKLTASFAPAR